MNFFKKLFNWKPKAIVEIDAKVNRFGNFGNKAKIKIDTNTLGIDEIRKHIEDIGAFLKTVKLFDYLGNWNQGTTYARNKLVSHNNELYLSSEDNNDTEPSATNTKWVLIEKPINIDLTFFEQELQRLDTELTQLRNHLQNLIVNTLPVEYFKKDGNVNQVVSNYTRFNNNVNFGTNICWYSSTSNKMFYTKEATEPTEMVNKLALDNALANVQPPTPTLRYVFKKNVLPFSNFTKGSLIGIGQNSFESGWDLEIKIVADGPREGVTLVRAFFVTTNIIRVPFWDYQNINNGNGYVPVKFEKAGDTFAIRILGGDWYYPPNARIEINAYGYELA